MTHEAIESYIEKVYGYAVNRTYCREEADELAQEILFTVFRELPKLRDESKFEPWLWSVAANVTRSFRRSMGKQRAMYSYDTLESLSFEDEYFKGEEEEEIYASLREKIAMLSSHTATSSSFSTTTAFQRKPFPKNSKYPKAPSDGGLPKEEKN